MNPIKLTIGDVIITKKKHPCSSDSFRVMRLGSDVRIVCTGCGRDLTVSRESVEKMIKRVVSKEENV